MTTAAHDIASADEPVQIAVLVVDSDAAEMITVSGSVRSAIRLAFAHPRLTSPLKTLQMDADRMIARIVTRWQNPTHARESTQTWEKSDGSTTVRWWVDRTSGLTPRVPTA